jgi:hypothetical protein
MASCMVTNAEVAPLTEHAFVAWQTSDVISITRLVCPMTLQGSLTDLYYHITITARRYIYKIPEQ